MAEPSSRVGAPAGWFSRGVASIGLASFFSDWGHEITTSLLPSFLTGTLRAGAGTLGVIEGISDSLTGIGKLVAGPSANDPERRGRLATGGYLVTAAATGAIGGAATVWQAGALRATAWVARGVRSPARDALLASIACEDAYGRAFGVERAGDNLGAVAGPLTAALLVAWLGIRPSLYLAAVPGLFAAAAITAAARDARALRRASQPTRGLELGALRRAGLARPLVPLALFELGNMASTLLILRATDLLHAGTRSVATATALAVLAYAGHNLVASIAAFASGHWVDRAGPRLVFATGGAVYVAAYASFSAAGQAHGLLVVGFLLAGCGIGLAETAESALVAGLLPDQLRGSGFGVLGGLQSLGDFASSASVGLLWALTSPSLAFAYAAAWMVLSVGTAPLLGRRR
jgi:MFS family permease